MTQQHIFTVLAPHNQMSNNPKLHVTPYTPEGDNIASVVQDYVQETKAITGSLLDSESLLVYLSIHEKDAPNKVILSLQEYIKGQEKARSEQGFGQLSETYHCLDPSAVSIRLASTTGLLQKLGSIMERRALLYTEPHNYISNTSFLEQLHKDIREIEAANPTSNISLQDIVDVNNFGTKKIMQPPYFMKIEMAPATLFIMGTEKQTHLFTFQKDPSNASVKNVISNKNRREIISTLYEHQVIEFVKETGQDYLDQLNNRMIRKYAEELLEQDPSSQEGQRLINGEASVMERYAILARYTKKYPHNQDTLRYKGIQSALQYDVSPTSLPLQFLAPFLSITANNTQEQAWARELLRSARIIQRSENV